MTRRLGALPAKGRVPMRQVRHALRTLGKKARACRVSPSTLREGMEVEREHADVTRRGVTSTARIALAHLCERPDYYRRLKRYVEEGGMRKKRLGDPPAKHLRTAGFHLEGAKRSMAEVEVAMRRGDCMGAVAEGLRGLTYAATAVTEADYGRSVSGASLSRARATQAKVQEQVFGRVLQACVVKKR